MADLQNQPGSGENTASPIRVGIIGAGAIGLRVARMLDNHPDFQVCMICDANPDVANAAASQFASAKWSTDYREMLGESIDLVYVGVPPKFHHRIALDVLEAKKHIFCEKPLSLTLSEAEEMADAADKAGVVHAMHLPLHYDNGIGTFSEALHNGYIGELRQGHIRMVYPMWPRAWQQNPWIAGREQGGMIREVCPHLFHVVLRELGPVSAVEAHVTYPDDATSSELSASGVLFLESEARITVEAVANIQHPETVTIILYGTDGTIELRDWTTPYGTNSTDTLQPLPAREGSGKQLPGELARAVRGESADVCGFDVGLQIQQVLDAWEQSSMSGKIERVRRK